MTYLHRTNEEEMEESLNSLNSFAVLILTFLGIEYLDGIWEFSITSLGIIYLFLQIIRWFQKRKESKEKRQEEHEMFLIVKEDEKRNQEIHLLNVEILKEDLKKKRK